MLSRLMWMAIGLIIPLVMVAAYFASLGLWMRFMLVFEFGFNYFNDPQLMNGWILPPPFGFPLVSMSINNAALLVFGLIGAYRLARRSIPVRNIENLTDLAMVLWLVVSFGLAGSRGGGFPYYVLPVVPPLALTASIEINTAYQRLKSSSKPSANLVRSASLALVIGLFLWSNYSLYHDNAMYKLGRISYHDFLQNVGEEEFASRQISNYVKAHTEPDDFIYLWGNRVEVYYYADRLPPVDILWPHYLAATGAPERIFDPKTKYIVLETLERMQRPQWLLDGLATHCDFETALEGREIYFCQGH
jgi:hypothetical protein